jgi:cell wall-associated NlpC family hydrolase
MDPMLALEQQSMNQTLLYLVGLLAGLMAQQQMRGGLGRQAQSLGGSSGSASGGGGGAGPNVPLGEGAGVQKFIDVAKAQQGDPYVFGATGPDKFDCSGLVYYSLRQAGVNVPRLTAAGYQNMFKDSRVDKANLKPGDLIFYHYTNSRGIPTGQASHIEIYLGNGMSMGTDSPSEGARIEPVDWSHFIGGARVPQLYR